MALSVSDNRIDAGADALRKYEQGNKLPKCFKLKEWSTLPKATRRKWQEKSRIVLEAAAQCDLNK